MRELSQLSAPEAFIHLKDVTLRFQSHGQSSRRLKQMVIDVLRGRPDYNYCPNFDLFQSLNIEIRNGERVGVIGGNGSGKTTLLKLISGIYFPTRGSIYVRGRISSLIELGAGFNVELSARENILLNGSFLGFTRGEMAEKAEHILRFAELMDCGDTPIKYFSSGMMLRIAFSIATDVMPEVLLIDEIFGAGDASFVGRATQRMRTLLDSSHIAVFVSHNLDLIQKICTRVIWLKKGQIAMDGKPQDVCNGYLGSLHEQVLNGEFAEVPALIEPIT
jgi:ABC-type polysaccharide/polyol phosphate transport system ATPase subunit